MIPRMVSIVIPLYNRSGLIARCLGSVLAQDYPCMEVLVVDDGSTDDGLNVLARWADDARVRVIRQPHGGVSVARNRGLDEAQGEYVMFVDSDDELLPRAVSRAVQRLEEEQVDCVLFTLERQSALESHVDAVPAQGRFENLDDYLVAVDALYGVSSPVDKLFRRSLIGETRFPTNMAWGEDCLFSLECLGRARAFYRMPDVLYRVHVGTQGSLSGSYRPHLFADTKAQSAAFDAYLNTRPTRRAEGVLKRFLWLSFMECVRKLCLSGVSRAERRRTLQTWAADETVRSLAPYAAEAPWDCRCWKRGQLDLLPWAVRLCHAKRRLGQWVRGRFLRTR